MQEKPLYVSSCACGKYHEVQLVADWTTPLGFVIPKGFSSDLASVPKSFYWFMRPTEAICASIIHDYKLQLLDCGLFNYKRANKEWVEDAIKLDHLPPWKAYVAYVGLEVYRLVFA